MKNMLSSEKGFTLVEIAIVLVIIGLLIGAILKGQELIENAKIKKIKGDYDSAAAAYYAYFDRYNVIPGDDNDTTKSFITTANDGNGDGDIDGTWNAGTSEASNYIWQHLRGAGFLTGSGGTRPKHSFGGQIGIENTMNNITGPVVCFGNIPQKISIILDTKYDDNDANAGSIQADGGASYTDPDNICFKL